MNKIKLFAVVLFPIFFVGCAHQINISPNLTSLQNIDPSKKIDKRIGYYFVENREKEVITPGGGGDSVRYKPYKEIEDGLKKTLSGTFKSVSLLKSEFDEDKNNVDLLAEIKISTTSFSVSAVTWPPTQFGVNLSCNIKDLNGELIAAIHANGEGSSEFSEWFLADKGLSGKRASEDVLNKLQNLLLLNKNLKSLNLAESGVPKNHLSKEEISSSVSKNNWDASITEPDINGVSLIKVKSLKPITSLIINGEDQGEIKNGFFQVKKIIKIGEEEKFKIALADNDGHVETTVLTAKRKFNDSNNIKVARLNPALVKSQPNKDAVAIIIGIAEYKNLPRAEYANDDAKAFYDYAIRALGIKSEDIRLLVDADADEVGIYQAFKTWLPSRVRSTTDVYVYYSGHGLPTADGQGLYLLPQRAHRDFIDKTAITQQEINAAIQATRPRSVTVFLDACYSGQTRTGETLVLSARPVALKVTKTLFPDNFTVISASANDQIASSSPDLKHGIFSYYLMLGMEGPADLNQDGKITVSEMHGYLLENVGRQAGMANRRQEPQLTGDSKRVLLGRQ